MEEFFHRVHGSRELVNKSAAVTQATIKPGRDPAIAQQ